MDESSEFSNGCDEKYVLVDSEKKTVVCPPLGTNAYGLHPRVYLELSDHGTVTCPYCDTQYRRDN